MLKVYTLLNTIYDGTKSIEFIKFCRNKTYPHCQGQKMTVVLTKGVQYNDYLQHVHYIIG